MNSIEITPNKLNGSIVIPPSKSLCHRAIISASLAKGVSEISNVTMSDDIKATIDAMKTLGTDIKYYENKLIIDGTNTLQTTKDLTVDCNESGSTLRFLIPLALLCNHSVTFIGSGRLPERPINTYLELFKKSDISYTSNNDFIPLTVIPGDLSGIIEIPGNISSQFITGLLFALPLFPFDSEIKLTTPLESKGYVDMTIDILEKYGITIKNNNYKSFRIKGFQTYSPFNYTVEGDFSQAAFYLVAGALGSFIVCKGLNIDTKQGDKEIINVIEKFGGKVISDENGMAALPSTLKGRKINVSQIPDLVPVMAVMAAFANGETIIEGAGRLRIKESDRLSAISEQLNTLGATVIEKGDSLIIEGTAENITGGCVDSCNDHRIAMAMAIAATCCDEKVTVKSPECVKKSYPEFWKDYEKLGGVISFTE